MGKPASTINTPIGRLSFPFLFDTDDKGKYRCTVIFKASDDLAEIERIVEEAIENKWGAKPPKKIKRPIHFNEGVDNRDGERYGGYEEDEARHIRCWSTKAPKVVGREKDPATGLWLELTKDEVYAGCYVRASVKAYAGDHEEGGPYCSLILSNVQKVSEGEPLAGVITSPDDDFKDDLSAAASSALS